MTTLYTNVKKINMSDLEPQTNITYCPYLVQWTRKDGTVVSAQYMRKYVKKQKIPRPYLYKPKPLTLLVKKIRGLSFDKISQVDSFIQTLLQVEEPDSPDPSSNIES